jgi:2-methylcitrate dehydratase PrpD
MTTIVDRLAAFTSEARYDSLPPAVAQESKRLILDSLGCALAALDEPKGRIALDYARQFGTGDVTIAGVAAGASILGAAFANGELVNTLDYDAIMPPGHVTPYVTPAALAMAESKRSTGKDVIVATAVAHEASFRLGKAMDYLRDTKDGKVDPPPVFGYSSTTLGGAAAVARLAGSERETIADAIGIAAATAPVNAHWPWFKHAPASTIKYALAGQLSQNCVQAAMLAGLGHTGDRQILDDREFGFARFINTRRWDADKITDRLGEHWLFPDFVAYKPYPHCRILHSLFGCMTRLLEEKNIGPAEIEGIHVWVEGMVEQPVWLNRTLKSVHEAQFSIAHGVAFAAHRVAPGKAWQDPDLVFSPSVLSLMEKVTMEPHPHYVEIRAKHPTSQPAHVEIRARGQTFVAEQLFPKGSRSSQPDSAMTDDELVAKFMHNADGVLTPEAAKEVAAGVMALEAVDDFAVLARKLRPARDALRAAAE